MALSKAQALDAAREILAGARADEAIRLERIHSAMSPPPSAGDYTPTTAAQTVLMFSSKYWHPAMSLTSSPVQSLTYHAVWEDARL